MNQPVGQSRALRVFISYAHEDDALRTVLVEHLSQLRRDGLIENWHDRLISGGREWAGEIDDNLEAADIVLLLVSASFLASDYCYDKEMTRALERHESREARVVPVILRPCDWQTALFGKLQAFPKDAKPIVNWQPVDDGYLEVAQGLRRVIADIRGAMARGQTRTPEAPPGPEVPSQKRRLSVVAGVVLLALGLGRYGWFDAKQRDFEGKKAALERQLLDSEKFDSDKFSKELDSLLVQAPDDPDLILLDGDRRYHSDGPEQARERYARALELNPKLAEAHFRQGFISDRVGDLRQAQAHYRKAIELAPTTPKYRNNYAHTFLESGNYLEAIAEYGKIEEYVLAGVEMAKARWALGELAEARGAQDRALEWLENPDIAALPRNQEVWFFWVETSQGGTNTAWKEYRLLSLVEKRCYARLSLSATLLLQGQDEEARRAADAAGCSRSSQHVKEVLAADLTRYVEAVQPRWVESSREFRERYLSSDGQAAAGVAADGKSDGR